MTKIRNLKDCSTFCQEADVETQTMVRKTRNPKEKKIATDRNTVTGKKQNLEKDVGHCREVKHIEYCDGRIA